MFRLVLLRILESYFRHRWLNLLPIILMWVVAGASFFFGKAVYITYGVLYVEQTYALPQITQLNDSGSWDTVADQTTLELTELLQTDAFVRSIINETDLEEYMDDGPIVVGRLMEEVRKAVWATSEGNNQVGVSAAYKEPVVAYQLVNATIEQYRQWKININRVGSVTAVNFYTNLLTEYKGDVAVARQELDNFLAAHPDSINGSRPAVEEVEFTRLQSELELAQTNRVDTIRSLESAELALSLAESSVLQRYFFIDTPQIPEDKVVSKKDIVVKIIIFTVVGVILSVVSIIGGVLLDRSFRFPIDVQYGVSLPVIAIVPKIE